MTVQTLTRRTDYIADGVQTVYAYDFLLLVESHLEVYFDGVLQVGGFTVQGVGNPGGGTVTFAVAPSANVELTLLREVPLTQDIDYTEYDSFPAETHESGLDLGVMRDQQLAEFDERTLHYNVIDAPDGGSTLPPPQPFQAIGYDQNGNLTNLSVGVGGEPVVNPLQDDVLSGGTYGYVVTDGFLSELGRFDHTGINVPNQILLNGVNIDFRYADAGVADTHYNNGGIHFDDIPDGVTGIQYARQEISPGVKAWVPTQATGPGGGGGGVPVGSVIAYSGTNFPDNDTTGWALADGQALLKASYPELDAIYSAANYPYGSTGTTFNLPDINGRVIAGTGQGDTAEGGGLGPFYNIGTKFGKDQHTLVLGEMPNHEHGVPAAGNPTSVSPGPGAAGGSALGGNTGDNGNDQPHENRQASIALNWFVRLEPDLDPPGAVDSVFNRTGDVVAEPGDYNSDLVDNASTVAGATVSDALENIRASTIPNILGVQGDLLTHSGSDYQRLARGTQDQVLSVDPTGNFLLWRDESAATGVITWNNRSGAVLPQGGDYQASQVTNNSTVTGATVALALDEANRPNVLNNQRASLIVGVPTGSGYSPLLPGDDGQVLKTRGGPGAQNLVWEDESGSGGVSTFTALTDTPASYTGESGKFAAVNGAENGLEFVDPPAGSGDVTITGNTTDDDVMLGAAASKGIKNSGVPFANMARRDGENTFTADQLIGGTTAPARLDLFQANQILESGRFNVESSSGFFSISSEDDSGAQVGNPGLAYSHENNLTGGGLILGTAAFFGSGTFNAESGLYDGGQRVYSANNPPPAGSSTFLGLTDTPGSYTGEGGKIAAVNVAENALEFIDAPAGSAPPSTTIVPPGGDVDAAIAAIPVGRAVGEVWTIQLQNGFYSPFAFVDQTDVHITGSYGTVVQCFAPADMGSPGAGTRHPGSVRFNGNRRCELRNMTLTFDDNGNNTGVRMGVIDRQSNTQNFECYFRNLRVETGEMHPTRQNNTAFLFAVEYLPGDNDDKTSQFAIKFVDCDFISSCGGVVDSDGGYIFRGCEIWYGATANPNTPLLIGFEKQRGGRVNWEGGRITTGYNALDPNTDTAVYGIRMNQGTAGGRMFLKDATIFARNERSPNPTTRRAIFWDRGFNGTAWIRCFNCYLQAEGDREAGEEDTQAVESTWDPTVTGAGRSAGKVELIACRTAGILGNVIGPDGQVFFSDDIIMSSHEMGNWYGDTDAQSLTLTLHSNGFVGSEQGWFKNTGTSGNTLTIQAAAEDSLNGVLGGSITLADNEAVNIRAAGRANAGVNFQVHEKGGSGTSGPTTFRITHNYAIAGVFDSTFYVPWFYLDTTLPQQVTATVKWLSYFRSGPPITNARITQGSGIGPGTPVANLPVLNPNVANGGTFTTTIVGEQFLQLDFSQGAWQGATDFTLGIIVEYTIS